MVTGLSELRLGNTFIKVLINYNSLKSGHETAVIPTIERAVLIW